MKDTAKRAAVATLVVGAIVVAALALWELRLVVALLFLAFIVAAAMRPTVEKLAGRGVPRPAGIGVHYLVFVVLVAAFLWAVVPRAIEQVNEAIEGLPATRSDLGAQAQRSDGIRHDILVGIQRRLEDLPSGERLVDPAVE
ncbi:MAG TPA: AI-2E family transporter, partial [Gaiellaceae bacterium]|nr:AI-2E family transporter [Gaiellaceae bacterium]